MPIFHNHSSVYLLNRVRDGSSERHHSYRRQRWGELGSRSEKKSSPSFNCDENPNSPSTISSPSSPSRYEQKQDFSMSRSKGPRFQEPRGRRPSPKNHAGGDSEQGGGQHLEQTLPRHLHQETSRRMRNEVKNSDFRLQVTSVKASTQFQCQLIPQALCPVLDQKSTSPSVSSARLVEKSSPAVPSLKQQERHKISPQDTSVQQSSSPVPQSLDSAEFNLRKHILTAIDTLKEKKVKRGQVKCSVNHVNFSSAPTLLDFVGGSAGNTPGRLRSV